MSSQTPNRSTRGHQTLNARWTSSSWRCLSNSIR